MEFPDDVLERFAPLREIGAGGMGTVFLARDRDLSRPVAIKLLRDGGSERTRERFLREAHLMARLEHPNVVRLYSAGVGAQGPWIAMEHVEGEPLHRVPRKVRAVQVLLDLAEGIQALHDLGLVHRDVKPPNVILTPDDRPVLLDLGLTLDVDRSRLTPTGVVVGTLGFVAPEVLQGERAGPPADWYAWGVTAFTLLEGRYPFEMMQLLSAAQGEELPAPEFRRLDPAGPMAEMILGTLRADPAARPAGVAALREIFLAAEARREGLPDSRKDLHELRRPVEAPDAAGDGHAKSSADTTVLPDPAADSPAAEDPVAEPESPWWATRVIRLQAPSGSWSLFAAGILVGTVFSYLLSRPGAPGPAPPPVAAKAPAPRAAALLAAWDRARGAIGVLAGTEPARGSRTIPPGFTWQELGRGLAARRDAFPAWERYLADHLAWVRGREAFDADPALVEAAYLGPFRVGRRLRFARGMRDRGRAVLEDLGRRDPAEDLDDDQLLALLEARFRAWCEELVGALADLPPGSRRLPEEVLLVQLGRIPEAWDPADALASARTALPGAAAAVADALRAGSFRQATGPLVTDLRDDEWGPAFEPGPPWWEASPPLRDALR